MVVLSRSKTSVPGSLRDWLSSLSEAEQKRLLASLSEADLDQFEHDWEGWIARPEQQIPPGDWYVWFIRAGRGFGKTRTGAETVREWAKHYRFVNLIGATADDARDIMVQGESGILAICPNGERPIYRKSDRQLVWPNGGKSLIFTADEPERLRGKQGEKLWADEVGAWRYEESWHQAMFGLRLGDKPQAVVTTTPRPTNLIKELLADPRTVETQGSTYDNRANLAPDFFTKIITRYEGTRLGRQELDAEILDDVPGALWTLTQLNTLRVLKAPAFRRVVVGVDPAITSSEGADETGIIVCGFGQDGQGYVLDDLSIRASPHGWASAAVTAYYKHKADRIIAEANQGGEMVEHTIKTVDSTVPVKLVHASRGKQTRAEPIASLYEKGQMHHVGTFPKLEDQMANWTPDQAKSPDRMDALVWAFTELMLNSRSYAPL